MELNKRAIDQARESINKLDFVRRYRLSPQSAGRDPNERTQNLRPNRSDPRRQTGRLRPK
jgi:hypothetical protein